MPGGVSYLGLILPGGRPNPTKLSSLPPVPAPPGDPAKASPPGPPGRERRDGSGGGGDGPLPDWSSPLFSSNRALGGYSEMS